MAAQMASGQNETGFLQGVRVLDMSQFEAGPACSEVLAWFGAEVIKIENPRGGDPTREGFDRLSGKDSWYFLMFNANKKSVSVDLKKPRGLQLVKDLASKADVFIENFAPGTIEKLGLGYEVLKEINPSIIFGQVKGFGHGSPYEKYLSFDMTTQACGGLMSITGERDGPPVKPGITIGDTGSGMLLLISILGALYRRKGTGRGERIEVAMQDAMLHFIRWGLSAQKATGQPQPRNGAKVPANPPSGVFPCKPGGPNDYVYIYTGRGNVAHWHRILKVIGRSELVGDPRFETAAARRENEAEVDAMITNWSRTLDKREAMQVLGEAGVPSGAVYDTLELQEQPDFEARGVMQTMQHPVNGPFKMPAWPVLHGGQAPRVAAAPLLGEHTDEVLRELLELSEPQLLELREAKVIGPTPSR
jgi:formyl-CoA transferase